MKARIHRYGGDIIDGLPSVRHWQLIVDNKYITDTSNEEISHLLLNIADTINRNDEASTSRAKVPTEIWIADVSDLLTALMYGNPPGGWSDPERRQQFQDRLIDIEARLRLALMFRQEK
jgi:hypothetical protein